MKLKNVVALLALLTLVVSGASAQSDFFEAAKSGTPRQVEDAIRAGAAVNARSAAMGMTPLMIAAKFNRYPAVIEALLKAGARLDDRDDTDAATPLVLAAGWNDSPDVVRVLLAAGSEIDARDGFNNKTPLMFAAMYGTNPEIVFVLLNAGADGRLKSFKGLTAWDYAERNPAMKGTRELADLDQARK